VELSVKAVSIAIKLEKIVDMHGMK